MSNNQTGQGTYSIVNDFEERDMAAKDGPSTTLGIADDAHNISHPYDEDIQTQLAAKSTANKKINKDMNDDRKTGQGDDNKIKNRPNKYTGN